MATTLLSLLAATTAMAALDEAPGVELRYSGTLTSVEGPSGETVVKRFELYALVTNKDSGARDLAFLVTETGGGGWAWPERYGRIPLDSGNRPTEPLRIRLLHRHEGIATPVILPMPVVPYTGRLGPDAAWTTDSERYEVIERAQVEGRSCWRVEVSKRVGRVGTLWVAEESPLLVSGRRRVVMGRGDRFQLRMNLDSATAVEADRLAQLSRPLDTLLELQNALNRPENEARSELDAEQLQAASDVLDRLQDEAEPTPFADLVTSVRRDVASQQKRARSVAELTEKWTGRAAPEFQLETLDGERVDGRDLSGRVVLLHFWPYRSEPLVEPYGQVGYLDYLHQQRGKLDVEVYGVAVDSRLADDDQAAPARRGIRKLKDFMNLSYPIATDDETVLKAFGDPRRFDAELPLWIVIGPEGTVAHYKVGFYDIDPDKGLEELDGVIAEQVRRRRSGNGE